MSSPPESLRLVVQLPVPPELAVFEPFLPIGSGYGIAQLTGPTAADRAAVALACRQAALRGATVGYSAVERVSAVFFDMDATVVNEESLVELAAYAGVSERVAAITERAMAGELDFRAALIARVALLGGLPEAVLALSAERLTLMAGIQPLVAFCREIGVPTFLISGGFVQLAGPIARKVGFDGFHANTLGVAAGKLTGKVDGDVVDAAAKRAFLLATCARLGLEPSRCAAVGDGANDLPMLQAAGVAVGHLPKPVLLPHVHAVNATGNHDVLGPLLFGRDIRVTRTRVRT